MAGLGAAKRESQPVVLFAAFLVVLMVITMERGAKAKQADQQLVEDNCEEKCSPAMSLCGAACIAGDRDVARCLWRCEGEFRTCIENCRSKPPKSDHIGTSE